MQQYLALQRAAGNRATTAAINLQRVSTAEQRADEQALAVLRRRLGRAPAVQALIAFAASAGISARSLLDASTATGGQPLAQFQAANVYAIGRAAGHAAAEWIRTGAVKVAVAPASFPPELLAAYVSIDTAVLRADTLYVRSHLRADHLGSRSVVIHELEHALQDGTQSLEPGYSPTVGRAEFEAYRVQARYVISQLLMLRGQAQSAAMQQQGPEISAPLAVALMMEAQPRRATVEPLLVGLFAAAVPGMQLSAAQVRQVLNQPPGAIRDRFGVTIVNQYNALGLGPDAPAPFDGWRGHSPADVAMRTGRPTSPQTRAASPSPPRAP